MRTLIVIVLVGLMAYMVLGLGAQSNDTQDQVAAAEARARAAEVELEAAKVRIAELEKMIAELDRLAQSMEAERRQKAEEVAGLNNAVASLIAERDSLKANLAIAVAQYGELSGQAEILRKTLTEREQSLAELQSRLAARDLELAGARQRVLALELRLAEQTAVIQGLRQQVSDLTDQLTASRRGQFLTPLLGLAVVPAALLVVNGLPAIYRAWDHHRRRNLPLPLSPQPGWLALADERAYYHYLCQTQRHQNRRG